MFFFLGLVLNFPVFFSGAIATTTGWWQLKYFLFSPRKLGKISHFDYSNIFQMGRFNHQPEKDVFFWGGRGELDFPGHQSFRPGLRESGVGASVSIPKKPMVEPRK